MSEPEDVLLEGAHAATTFVHRLWRRNRAGPRELRLVDVRRRLELLVGALYGSAAPIVVADPPARQSFIGRLVRRVPRHLIDLRALSGTDGQRIRLPRTLSSSRGDDVAFDLYRLLAVEQAARVTRGTALQLIPALEPLTRDLYLLAEATSIDHEICRELPGLRVDVEAARRSARRERPPPRVLSPIEREVERLLIEVLETDPTDSPRAVPLCASRAASIAWAADAAALLRSTMAGRYRGTLVVSLWGRVEAAEGSIAGRRANDDEDNDQDNEQRIRPQRVHNLTRRPRTRAASEDEDDGPVGMWMMQLDAPQEHAEDPMGLQRPTDRDDLADPAALADSLSELPEARLVASPGSPAEVLVSDDPPHTHAILHASPHSMRTKSAGVSYPEWDYRVNAYHEARAMVREHTPLVGASAWADTVLRRHAQEVQQIRRRFERLRPQRTRQGRQADGPDIDLSAYVTGYADLLAGCAPDGRLYETTRPARRDIAIMLLVDVSGSTDSWVGDTRRIVDVEKEALLLVCEALDALGDRYSIVAFSGEGPKAVSTSTVKAFGERNTATVRQRIAALEPDRYTRTGAAIRHATAALVREKARHRLLLVLSDGKPNDVDIYEGRYGIEDTRQAVAEAQLQGLHPFCITVDREAPAYIARIFGAGSYAVLRHARTLPLVLIEVVRRLVKT